MLSFVAWTYFVLRYAGFKVLVFDLFGNKSDKKEVGMLMWVLLIPIFFAVGGIEVVSMRNKVNRLEEIFMRLVDKSGSPA